MKAVITVTGRDNIGIIARVSTECAKYGANILDISQTIMQDLFTMIMLVDMGDCSKQFDAIRSELDKMAEEINVTIKIQHEDIFNSMHRI